MNFTIIKLLFKFLFNSNSHKLFHIQLRLLLECNKKKIRFLRKFFQNRIFYNYNCDIDHYSKIHNSTKFGHPIGIVIGSNVIIEENCSIYQGVTLGANFMKNNDMPHIKKDTIISAGAKIIGGGNHR